MAAVTEKGRHFDPNVSETASPILTKLGVENYRAKGIPRAKIDFDATTWVAVVVAIIFVA